MNLEVLICLRPNVNTSNMRRLAWLCCSDYYRKASWKIICRPRGVIKVWDKQLIAAILIEIKKVSNLYFPDIWVCINCFLCEQEIFPFLQVGCIWWRTPRHVGYVSWQQTICTPRWFFVSLFYMINHQHHHHHHHHHHHMYIFIYLYKSLCIILCMWSCLCVEGCSSHLIKSHWNACKSKLDSLTAEGSWSRVRTKSSRPRGFIQPIGLR